MKSAMTSKTLPLPFPCLRTNFHNKGPGRKKLGGKFSSEWTGRLEQLYYATYERLDNGATFIDNRPPRLCLTC